MYVISFSTDQMKIDGWLRSALTQAWSCVRQLSNRSVRALPSSTRR